MNIFFQHFTKEKEIRDLLKHILTVKKKKFSDQVNGHFGRSGPKKRQPSKKIKFNTESKKKSSVS